MHVTKIRPINRYCRFADALLVPFMYLASGTFRERPQQTHAWHVQNLTFDEEDRLEREMIVSSRGTRAIPHRTRFDIRFHLPIFGGWTEYAVIAPVGYAEPWHVGWVLPHCAALHRLPIRGPVRMLRGPDDAYFFGISAEGHQIPLRIAGSGTIGTGGPYGKVPLF